MSKIPVIAVVGPTASGKSWLGVEICKRFNGEVVSADSMQVYKNMNIATAKPSVEEMQGVAHHMIDMIEPEQNFSVFNYCELAGECISEIYGRGKLPVLVGGTGLYIDSLLNNIKFAVSEISQTLRQELENRATEKGNGCLYSELMDIDPQTASKLHQSDRTRIIRALELYYSTGLTASAHNLASKSADTPYKPFIIGINFRDRQKLYESINNRIDKMLREGLIDEAKLIFDSYDRGTSRQAIGIKELFGYFEGKKDLDTAIALLKQDTRRYAKRQMTWFRKNDKINWLYRDDYSSPDAFLHEAFDLIAKSEAILR